jgi:predicted dehydrogenase/threonine dehydrogenase-like Zn-dependent dehydrogenase
MLQVVQYQKDGQISFEEMPMPQCPEGGVLVRNIFSLISAGTERTSVTNTQSSLLQRAKKQPEQVKLVLDFLKKEGIMSTINRVKSKLDSYKNLGYSTAGIVVESSCDEFKPGDHVACAGAGFAVHAEIVAIPKNLVAKIPDGVTFEQAAYTTLGSIALQGVRQADMRLGETVAVVGLGLLGQLAVQMLKASGCIVIGMDINEILFDRAKQYGCDYVCNSNSDNIKNVLAYTGGLGCDAVILAASTGSNEPVEMALKITRKKGKIVVLGAVGMNLPRSPFYEKEIDFRISCSYGPGRYDENYEINGNDYPPAYVRWTENRNMQAVLELIRSGKLDVNSMTTHTFSLKDTTKAYDLVTGKTVEPYLGILLSYPERPEAFLKQVVLRKEETPLKDIRLGFIGAGTFAQGYLLPNLKEMDIEMHSVSTATSVNALTAAKHFGFKISTTDSQSIIDDKEVNLVFCATKHDSHAKYVINSIKNNKAVFVEKPLAINREQLEEIDKAQMEFNGRLMVGYNRRFSKPFVDIKKFFGERRQPMIISYRVNAGKLPLSHWVYNENQGMGRIIGESCHFIDCLVYLTGSVPVRVFAECITAASEDQYNSDNTIITIKFSDGSIGTVQYISNGDGSVPKEYCEVFCEDSTAIMTNFTEVVYSRGGKSQKTNYDGKKGHKEEVAAMINALRKGGEMPISYSQLKDVSLVTLAALDSLDTGMPVSM